MDIETLTGNPVEAARKRVGLPLSGLSNATGIPRTTLRRKMQNPRTLTLAELEAIAAVLDADVTDMFAAINGEAA